MYTLLRCISCKSTPTEGRLTHRCSGVLRGAVALAERGVLTRRGSTENITSAAAPMSAVVILEAMLLVAGSDGVALRRTEPGLKAFHVCGTFVIARVTRIVTVPNRAELYIRDSTHA